MQGRPVRARKDQWTLTISSKFAKLGGECKKESLKLEKTSKPIKEIHSDKEDQVEKQKLRKGKSISQKY